MLESKISNSIVRFLRDNGWFVTKLQTTSTPGIPDLLCVKAGRSVFLEVKNEVGKLSELQKFRIDELKSHWSEVHVVRSLIDVKNIVYEQHSIKNTPDSDHEFWRESCKQDRGPDHIWSF